ncbi:serine carboxypeptidase-like 2 isoform X1 [Dendrobium catenatum]|uniref:serine carboxypeptidase-like 2 isoform X1 n=1 Tax=Dendrobium catenatum TaxID=906689 RepID=UPI00109F47EC|nr:serine carboxypeptidase-like 2 isoform X1 [Dendrobium catenatum]
MARWSPVLLLLSFLVILQKSISSTPNHVQQLPGFKGQLPFQMETGYLTVDEVNGVELFYYFIESERNASEDPLLLWLSGGPGCSSFSALFFEIGPVKFQIDAYDGSVPTLLYNPYSWTKVSSIIFLDYPAGTGFSVPTVSQTYMTGDSSSSNQVYGFLKKWLVEHPRFRTNGFYVAGDSYGGMLVPVVAQFIADGNDVKEQPFINLQGYIIGNPRTGERIDTKARVPFALGMGIISDEFAELVEKDCAGQDYENPKTAECAARLDTFKKYRWELSETDVLEPKCATDFPRPKDIAREYYKRSLNEDSFGRLFRPPKAPELRCKGYAYYLGYFWANENVTREALQIRKGTVSEWQRCNNFDYLKDIPSSLPYQLNLLKRGYRALVYSGDHDMLIPFVGTKLWIKSLNLTVVDPWRSWSVDDQVAGYTVLYSNDLTFATVRAAGHTAPEFKPQQCFAMFDRFTMDFLHIICRKPRYNE